MSKETSLNHDLTGTSASAKEKQDQFRACVDPSENARQIASIGEMLEEEITAIFETSRMSDEMMLASKEGKELSAALGPKVLLTQRDEFFVEKLADRYNATYGQPVYYTKSTDVPIGVVSASMSDNGAPMAGNPLITMKGYDVPIPVNAQRLVMNFEYDDPRLAESNFSSRSKAVDQARYRIRKAYQDLVIAAWVGGFTATFSAAQKHQLPAGRVHPTTNIIDVTGAPNSGVLLLDVVAQLSNYFDTIGFTGQKMLFVSPKHFNEIKKWVSTSSVTDAGLVFAKQIFQSGGSVDSIPVYDTLVVKKNLIPDDSGYALVVDDGPNSPTLGIYQYGKIQTVPSNTNKPLRAAFDVYIPGVAGVCHDQVRVAKVKFA